MIKDVIMREDSGTGAGVTSVTLKIKWGGFLKIIWRCERRASTGRWLRQTHRRYVLYSCGTGGTGSVV
jgi:hypothetical protein